MNFLDDLFSKKKEPPRKGPNRKPREEPTKRPTKKIREQTNAISKSSTNLANAKNPGGKLKPSKSTPSIAVLPLKTPQKSHQRKEDRNKWPESREELPKPHALPYQVAATTSAFVNHNNNVIVLEEKQNDPDYHLIQSMSIIDETNVTFRKVQGSNKSEQGGDDLSRSSSITNLNADSKNKGALSKNKKSASKDRLDKISDRKHEKKGLTKNNNKIDDQLDFPAETLQEIESLQRQLQEMANEKSSLALELGEQKGHMHILENEMMNWKKLHEELSQENNLLRNRLKDVAHSPLSDNEKQQLLLESHRHHSSAPASIATNLIDDGAAGDVTACPTPDWDKHSSSNVSEISVACLQDRINQMEETHYSTKEELQATVQELNDLQRQLSELQQDNYQLLEDKNLMFDSLCRQTERLNESKGEIESLKQRLRAKEDDTGQYEAAVEHEQKLLALLKDAQEEREMFLLKQEQLTGELQEALNTNAQQTVLIEQLNERIKTLESTLDAKHAEHKQLEQELVILKDQSSGMQIEIDRLSDLLENARTKIVELEQDRALSDKSELDEMLDNARKEKDALESEVTNLKEQVARSKNESEKLKDQVSILQEECKVTRNNAKCTQSELEYKCEILTADKNALNDQLQQLQEAANGLQVQAQCQLEDKRQLSTVLSETQKLLSEAERRNQELESELADLKKLRKEENEEWEKFQNDLLTSVRVANDFKTEAQQDLQKMIMENKAHREKVRHLEAQINKLRDNDHSAEPTSPVQNEDRTKDGQNSSLDVEPPSLPSQDKNDGKLKEDEVLLRSKSSDISDESKSSKEDSLKSKNKAANSSSSSKNLFKKPKIFRNHKGYYVSGPNSLENQETSLEHDANNPQANHMVELVNPPLPAPINIESVEETPPVQENNMEPITKKILNILPGKQKTTDVSSAKSPKSKKDQQNKQHLSSQEQKDLKALNELYAAIDPNIPEEFLTGEQKFIVKLKQTYDSTLERNKVKPVANKPKNNLAISKPLLTSVISNPKLKQIADDPTVRVVEDDATKNLYSTTNVFYPAVQPSTSRKFDDIHASSIHFNYYDTEDNRVTVGTFKNDGTLPKSKSLNDLYFKNDDLSKVSNYTFTRQHSTGSLTNFASPTPSSNLNPDALENPRSNRSSLSDSGASNVSLASIAKVARRRSVNQENLERTLNELSSGIDPKLPDEELTNEQLFLRKMKHSMEEMGRKQTLRKERKSHMKISEPTKESVWGNPKLVSVIKDEKTPEVKAEPKEKKMKKLFDIFKAKKAEGLIETPKKHLPKKQISQEDIVYVTPVPKVVEDKHAPIMQKQKSDTDLSKTERTTAPEGLATAESTSSLYKTVIINSDLQKMIEGRKRNEAGIEGRRTCENDDNSSFNSDLFVPQEDFTIKNKTSDPYLSDSSTTSSKKEVIHRISSIPPTESFNTYVKHKISPGTPKITFDYEDHQTTATVTSKDAQSSLRISIGFDKADSNEQDGVKFTKMPNLQDRISSEEHQIKIEAFRSAEVKKSDEDEAGEDAEPIMRKPKPDQEYIEKLYRTRLSNSQSNLVGLNQLLEEFPDSKKSLYIKNAPKFKKQVSGPPTRPPPPPPVAPRPKSHSSNSQEVKEPAGMKLSKSEGNMFNFNFKFDEDKKISNKTEAESSINIEKIPQSQIANNEDGLPIGQDKNLVEETTLVLEDSNKEDMKTEDNNAGTEHTEDSTGNQFKDDIFNFKFTFGQLKEAKIVESPSNENTENDQDQLFKPEDRIVEDKSIKIEATPSGSDKSILANEETVSNEETKFESVEEDPNVNNIEDTTNNIDESPNKELANNTEQLEDTNLDIALTREEMIKLTDEFILNEIANNSDKDFQPEILKIEDENMGLENTDSIESKSLEDDLIEAEFEKLVAKTELENQQESQLSYEEIIKITGDFISLEIAHHSDENLTQNHGEILKVEGLKNDEDVSINCEDKFKESTEEITQNCLDNEKLNSGLSNEEIVNITAEFILTEITNHSDECLKQNHEEIAGIEEKIADQETPKEISLTDESKEIVTDIIVDGRKVHFDSAAKVVELEEVKAADHDICEGILGVIAPPEFNDDDTNLPDQNLPKSNEVDPKNDAVEDQKDSERESEHSNTSFSTEIDDSDPNFGSIMNTKPKTSRHSSESSEEEVFRRLSYKLDITELTFLRDVYKKYDVDRSKSPINPEDIEIIEKAKLNSLSTDYENEDLDDLKNDVFSVEAEVRSTDQKKDYDSDDELTEAELELIRKITQERKDRPVSDINEKDLKIITTIRQESLSKKLMADLDLPNEEKKVDDKIEDSVTKIEESRTSLVVEDFQSKSGGSEDIKDVETKQQDRLDGSVKATIEDKKPFIPKQPPPRPKKIFKNSNLMDSLLSKDEGLPLAQFSLHSSKKKPVPSRRIGQSVKERQALFLQNDSPSTKVDRTSKTINISTSATKVKGKSSEHERFESNSTMESTKNPKPREGIRDGRPQFEDFGLEPNELSSEIGKLIEELDDIEKKWNPGLSQRRNPIIEDNVIEISQEYIEDNDGSEVETTSVSVKPTEFNETKVVETKDVLGDIQQLADDMEQIESILGNVDFDEFKRNFKEPRGEETISNRSVTVEASRMGEDALSSSQSRNGSQKDSNYLMMANSDGVSFDFKSEKRDSGTRASNENNGADVAHLQKDRRKNSDPSIDSHRFSSRFSLGKKEEYSWSSTEFNRASVAPSQRDSRKNSDPSMDSHRFSSRFSLGKKEEHSWSSTEFSRASVTPSQRDSRKNSDPSMDSHRVSGRIDFGKKEEHAWSSTEFNKASGGTSRRDWRYCSDPSIGISTKYASQREDTHSWSSSEYKKLSVAPTQRDYRYNSDPSIDFDRISGKFGSESKEGHSWSSNQQDKTRVVSNRSSGRQMSKSWYKIFSATDGLATARLSRSTSCDRHLFQEEIGVYEPIYANYKELQTPQKPIRINKITKMPIPSPRNDWKSVSHSETSKFKVDSRKDAFDSVGILADMAGKNQPERTESPVSIKATDREKNTYHSINVLTDVDQKTPASKVEDGGASSGAKPKKLDPQVVSKTANVLPQKTSSMEILYDSEESGATSEKSSMDKSYLDLFKNPEEVIYENLSDANKPQSTFTTLHFFKSGDISSGSSSASTQQDDTKKIPSKVSYLRKKFEKSQEKQTLVEEQLPTREGSNQSMEKTESVTANHALKNVPKASNLPQNVTESMQSEGSPASANASLENLRKNSRKSFENARSVFEYKLKKQDSESNQEKVLDSTNTEEEENVNNQVEENQIVS